ncbi:glycosyltransferase [Falsiroseomonas sp.]|uniref:glycosyltransferase n=1 Tax=Falsiroseomonas sp. TaxID=2870721 RepID=UPI003F6EC117
MSDVMTETRPASPVTFDETAALYDICFVLNVNSRGWILEKICRVIERASGAVCFYMFSETNDRFSYSLPPARNYFFAHFALAATALRKYPEARSANCFVWYTHPDLSKGVTKAELAELADSCTAVFTPCSLNRDTLVEWGAKAGNISVPLGGADPADFRPKIRDGKGAVGFVGAYYERKQPAKMLALARMMPEQSFILVGPRAEDVENASLLWHNWRHFAEFTALPNVRYVEAAYDEFPRWYAEFDVLCSASSLEGGPIPAIEAMMCNVVPVISDTGFARDIIVHGSTGHIFPVDATPEEIVPLIRAGLADTTTDIAAAAANFSWDSFGRQIWSEIRGEVALGETIGLDNMARAIRYLSRGFHLPESRGVWTRARTAELMVPLKRDARPTVLELYAWAPPEVGEAGAPVSFFVNGHQVHQQVVTPRAVTISLPIGALPPGGAPGTPGDAIRVLIQAERLILPSDRPAGSRERRSLGIKLGWFRAR